MVSVIDGGIHDGIKIGPESGRINTRRVGHGRGNHGSRNEPARLNGPQLRYRFTVAGYDERLSGLDFPKYRRGIIAQFALGDDSVHVRQRSMRSNL